MKLDHWIIDEDGNEKMVDLFTWARWFEKSDNRRIAQTEVGGYTVSTVFLGLDHNFGSSNNRPLLYETMVFKSDSAIDEHTRRYSTRSKAEEGHKEIVNELQKIYGTGETTEDV